MTFEFFHAVDTGRARSNNEDSVAVDEANALAVLADGMGGYNAGEVASTMATSFIKTELGRWLHEAMGHATDTEVRRAMDICVDNANRAIFNAANSNPQYAGMGTTLVVGVFREGRLLLGHVGDSRGYRLRDGVFDLDLCYITDRVIAFGLPAEGLEAAYRNAADEVARCLRNRADALVLTECHCEFITCLPRSPRYIENEREQLRAGFRHGCGLR